MNFQEFLNNNIVFLDGSMGTLLQQKGLGAGEYPERWNITRPDVITDIHKSYFDAGSNVVCTNTFGANILKFSRTELEEIIKSALENAERAKKESTGRQEKFVALDIGPTGKLLKPLGTLGFEEAVEAFAETVKLGVKYGAELVIIETMNDSYETKAALLAVKENCDLPVIVSNAYGEDSKLMTGATPEAMVAMCEGMGAAAIGANCSLGPAQLRGVVQRLIKSASIPVVLKPNAGLPKMQDGKTVYDVTCDDFANEVADMIKAGVRAAGGCCGTTPEYIKALTEASKGIKKAETEYKNNTVVSSYTQAVTFGEEPILIGERINPTGKKRFKQALLENDIDYILGEAVSQHQRGVHILDVNVGLPDIDEAAMLKSAVCEIQAVSDLPLQIDTADVKAMEQALRVYNGKAMINSVNGKEESMQAVFPLVKKYGGVVVALTLDESGIPDTAQGRVDIAKKILKTAEKYGIDKKDIIFDTLAMTVSADNNSARVTLEALKRIKEELGCNVTLGVSNVSFGLPARDAVNSVFFALALENGLSGAIMNPYSADMMKTYYSYRALKGLDANCARYIEAAQGFAPAAVPDAQKAQDNSDLQYAIIKGFKDKSAQITKELLKNQEPLNIVQNEIIPALNEVGKGFEEKRVYLPQLLMSAEAAKSAFEKIKEVLPASTGNKKSPVVIATVKGDIHDIGKNILKLLLENYGFFVVDMGKDVPPEAVADKAAELDAMLVGLSALMTTTVPAMEQTVQLLRQRAPRCKVMVGGAVLTQEYADKMGADKYARDAMEGVRYAQEIIK